MRFLLNRPFPTLSRLAAALILGSLICGSAQAVESDPLMDSAQLCMQHFARSESDNGIPKQLLSAIAMTESGRWSDTSKAVVPWPWTINTGGQGYYFDSMHEAVTFAKRLKDKGVDNMDVGCMQINLHHHPDAFANLLDAFDPGKNVAYGAKFLRGQFDDLQSWPEAIAAYHSRTPQYGHPYYANVRRNWQRVLHGGDYAVADARASTSPYGANRSYASGVAISRGSAENASAAKVERPRNSTFQISVQDEKGFRSIDENRRGRRVESRMPAMANSDDRSARVIHVGEGSSRQIANNAAPEVLVVRPVDKTEQLRAALQRPAGKAEAKTKDVTLAMSTAADNFVSSHKMGAAVHQVSVTDNASASKPGASRRAGPNFIFD